jgi:protein-S-isoprenylcysteine O-methyltransferase Ste14
LEFFIIEGGDRLPAERSRILGSLRLAGLYLFIGLLAWYSRPTPPLFLAGALLVLLGEGVRLWAAGHLIKSLELIDSGPYAYTQNPLYLGRLLILTGICIMCRSRFALNWLALLLGYLVFFGYYLPRKLRVEGTRLRKMHGDAWLHYQTSVPVLIPSRNRFPGKATPWSFQRAIRNQEYLVLAGVLAILAFLARKAWSP